MPRSATVISEPTASRQPGGARRDGVRSGLQHAPRPRDRESGARCPPARHARRPRPGARCPAAAPSRGGRRAPAAPARDRRGRRSGPAAAPCSVRPRAATPSRSTARPDGSRCAARCRFTRSAGRWPCSTQRRLSEPSTKQAAELLAGWQAEGSTLVLLDEQRGGAGKSFRNLSRVSVLPVDDAGVADVIGAASLLVSQAALPALVARANGGPASRRTRADGRKPGHHPSGRLREDLRARRGRQVHLPGRRSRTQDADPPGRRGAVRRQGRRGAHVVGQEQAQAPRRHTAGRTRQWKKAIVQVREGDSIPIFGQGLG